MAAKPKLASDAEPNAEVPVTPIATPSAEMTEMPTPMTETPVTPPGAETPVTIAKPSAFNLDKFKSKRPAGPANVETLLHSVADPLHFGSEGLRSTPSR